MCLSKVSKMLFLLCLFQLNVLFKMVVHLCTTDAANWEDEATDKYVQAAG